MVNIIKEYSLLTHLAHSLTDNDLNPFLGGQKVDQKRKKHVEIGNLPVFKKRGIIKSNG
jgi:hypothetical protein